MFSSRAKAIHQLLKGKLGDLQLPILNFLSGNDVFNLSKALGGGSVYVSQQDMCKEVDVLSLFKSPCNKSEYRCVITTDDWFDVDREYQNLAHSLFDTLKFMYDNGRSVVIAATMGVYSVPRTISTIFHFKSESQWKLASYTKKSISKTEVGNRILGDAFPFTQTYLKSHFVSAPTEECLFIEYIDPADYEDSDSDYEPERVPQPSPDTPIAVHFGDNGGSVSYFGFVNPLDVSYGAIMLRLANLSLLQQ